MLTIGWALDVGRKRRGKKNQDAIKIVGKRSTKPLVIVADGMGGFRGGAVASGIVVRTLKRAYRWEKRKQSLKELLYHAILKSHERIVHRSRQSETLAKMGSTVAAAVVDEEAQKAVIANVGDTRIYRIEVNGIEVISYDHSEAAELTRKGVLTEEEARDYARKNVLTMSLSAGRPHETIKPFVKEVAFPPHAALLLCSDGLWGVVPDHLIRLTVLEYSPQEAADKLVEFANSRGGPDNISVVIIRREGEWHTYREAYSLDKEDTH